MLPPIPDIEALIEAARNEERFELTHPPIAELLATQAQDPEQASLLLDLLQNAAIRHDAAPILLEAILDAHGDKDQLLARLGHCIEAAINVDALNDAAPQDAVFERLVEALRQRVEPRLASAFGRLRNAFRRPPVGPGTQEDRARMNCALASASWRCGRAHDKLAERAMRRVTQLRPEDSAAWFDMGLFFKTRGRFAESVRMNQRARALAGDDEPTLWNLGISATGAGQGAVAQEAWRALGMELELEALGLPQGKFGMVKVRLAEFPLAARGPDRDASGPGREESAWVERLSPCHGIVRSVLFDDFGVDYGDVVLWDGAPITHHQVGDSQVPVFPHLVTLESRAYDFFEFAGIQSEAGEIADLSRALPADGVVYSHTEQVRLMCAECWQAGRDLHNHGEEDRHGVVTGLVAIPHDLAPLHEVYARLQEALRESPHLEFVCPVLTNAAGDAVRAKHEEVRMKALFESLE